MSPTARLLAARLVKPWSSSLRRARAHDTVLSLVIRQPSRQGRFLSNKSNGTTTTTTATAATPTTATAATTTTTADAEPPYQSYEYPWATEPPVVTRTTAREHLAASGTAPAAAAKEDVDQATGAAAAAAIDSGPPTGHDTIAGAATTPTPTTTTSWWDGIFSSSTQDADKTGSNSSSATSTTADDDSASSSSAATTTIATSTGKATSMDREARGDPFDDSKRLSPHEISALRYEQQQSLPTTLSPRVKPVTASVPAYIPRNVPATELAPPQTLVSTLSNGVRVVSQETYGQVSTVGVVSQLGSRHESTLLQTAGLSNLLELTAFGAAGADGKYESAAAVAHQLQDWGGSRFVSTGREQSIHCIDLLRPGVANAVGLLSDVLLRPHFLQAELDEAKQAIQIQSLPEHMPPEVLMAEALQIAAYGPDQQLGQPHYCAVDALPGLTRPAAVAYWNAQLRHNPRGLVVGGAGVQHDELVALAAEHFGHLVDDDTGRVVTKPSLYRGGEVRVQLPTDADGGDGDAATAAAAADPDRQSAVAAEQRLTRVAVAVEIGGWHSDQLVAACVLQTLLGGGSSFSAGGPGKGMYSRLYRRVLNRYRWAESAEAFTAFHTESGLLGIAGSTPAAHAGDMVRTFCGHLARLAAQPVVIEELDRARNMLKNNVLMQLESRLVLLEDMARQVLTYGHREDVRATCAKIDAVTAADVHRLVYEACRKPPTLVAVGVDIRHVPPYEQVTEWMKEIVV